MELTTQVQFQEKMQERIRQGIGDLMPDESLKELVRRGVDEAFFKTVPEVRNQWNNVTQPEQKSWLIQFIAKELQPKVEIATKEWIAANQEKVQEIIKSELDKGIAACTVQAFVNMMNEPLDKFRNAVAEKFQGMGQGRVY